MSLVTRFRLTWIAGGLMLAGCSSLLHPSLVSLDTARHATLGYAAVAVGLTVLLGAAYHFRYMAQHRHNGHGMIPPHYVWGMGVSYIVLLAVQMRRITDRFGEPVALDVLVATAISVAFALYWLDAMVTRQIRRFP